MDYWKEHAEIALAEAGLPEATDAQLDAMAGVIESAHEFYGQYSGHDVTTDNFHAEKERHHKEDIEKIKADNNRELEAEAKRFKRANEDRSAMAWRLSDVQRENSRLKQNQR
jgi:uridine phosphorylase